jgi:hypothetical protein
LEKEVEVSSREMAFTDQAWELSRREEATQREAAVAATAGKRVAVAQRQTSEAATC